MTPKKYRFVDIKDLKPGMEFPSPRNLTPEEEAEILTQLRAEFDAAASEVELTELLRQRELGLLVSVDELEKEINELAAQYEETNEEPK